MASELVADFLATVDAPPLRQPQPGRVLMRQDHIVCVTDEHRVDVPLATVVDVGVGTVPGELRAFFEDSLTLVYRNGDARNTVMLEARANSMEQFRTILFKCLLHGQRVQIRYPAKRGGHVLDTTYETGHLVVDRGVLVVRRASDPDVTVDLDRVATFTKGRGKIHGENRWLISVGVVADETVVTARIAPDNERILALMARYLKLEYGQIHRDVVRMELEESTLQALVALDAGATDIGAMVPDIDDNDALLERLEDDGLVTANGDGITLTRRGRIATKTHLESVN